MEIRSIRESGFHPRTSALTRDFRDVHGFRLPGTYAAGGVVEDYWACRERLAIADLSALRKFEVLGPDAETLMATALTRDVRRLAVGQVTYSAMCDEAGGMVGDGTLFRLGPDNFRWVGNADREGDWLRRQAEALGLKVWIKPSTDILHNLAVQGPKSREALTDVIWTPPAQPSLAELAWHRFTVGRVQAFDGRSVVVSRSGTTGELGYEVWCHPKDAVAVWDAVWQAGAPHGLAPLGLDALDMLRIEAGVIAPGAEFNDQTDPFEAGIGFTVALETKSDDFIGREALLRRKENQERVLAGLELEGGAPPAAGAGVMSGPERIGVVTSATRSPVLDKTIALCRLDAAHGAPG
ncbi:MAG: aminomethyltransferase family protein, partial [Kiloniellales bacterium]|nr:aminomethyltransferase family protein [Kiloniellales bacterium]